jgi:predicted O-methyltransferase YrrM
MAQIIPEAVERYVSSLHAPVDEVLEAVGREGRAQGLPLVDPASGRLLRTLALAIGARRILEIGTAIGYSALWMAAALPPDGLIISIEADPNRAAVARDNFERAGVASQVSVIVGDATRYLHKVAGPFDLVFQDSHKPLYGVMLGRLVELLRPAGILVSDNVLWSGEVIEGYVITPQRDATSTEALRAYNRQLAAEPRLFTTFLPVGDGLAVSVRTGG